MTDEEVIRRRLIFDGDGTGDDRRFNLLIKMATKWLNSTEESPEEIRQTYDKISAQLALIEHSRRRSAFIMKCNEEQLVYYHRLYADYEKKIIEIKEEIAEQRRELEKAKIVKMNKMQYDLLAKEISGEPPRKEMNEKLSNLQKKLKELGEERAQLMQKLDDRKKKFYVLATSANQLKVSLEDDDNDGSQMSTSLDDVNANSPEPMSE